MLYSLFIFFLEILFIKWWLDSSKIQRHTKLIFIFGSIGLLAYGLFVSCIDRKRMNYQLARLSANIANIALSFTMWLIMHNIRLIRRQQPSFIKLSSWSLKKICCFVHLGAFGFGILMYSGEIPFEWKPSIEYAIVISTVIFLWSFTKDFKKFTMDIDNGVTDYNDYQ